MADRETIFTHVAYDIDSPTDRGDFFLITKPDASRFNVMISEAVDGNWYVVKHDTRQAIDVQSQTTKTVWAAIDLANEMLGLT